MSKWRSILETNRHIDKNHRAIENCAIDGHESERNTGKPKELPEKKSEKNNADSEKDKS